MAARPAFSNEDSNPYNSLLYRAVTATGVAEVAEHRYSCSPWTYDILHLHWPEFDLLPRSAHPVNVLKKMFVWCWLLLARVSGTKLVWTAHNDFGHDKKASFLNLFLWRRFLSLVDGVIYLSEESRRQVTAKYPQLAEKRSTVIKHGHYGPWIAAVRNKTQGVSPPIREALSALGRNFVILNIGQIRPYKNVDGLIQQFSRLADAQMRLVIAGSVPDKAYLEELRALAAADDRVILLPGHVDDASLIACLDRADLVVLPYRKILNSGSALLALSFGKHVVVPAIGSMRALQDDVGEGALSLFEEPFNVNVLRTSVERVRSAMTARPRLDEYEWPQLGARTAAFYAELTGRTA